MGTVGLGTGQNVLVMLVQSVSARLVSIHVGTSGEEEQIQGSFSQ